MRKINVILGIILLAVVFSSSSSSKKQEGSKDTDAKRSRVALEGGEEKEKVWPLRSRKGETLNFYDENGKVWKSIKLSKKEKKYKLKYRGKDLEFSKNHNISVVISANGKYAAITERDYDSYTGKRKAKFRYERYDGKVMWERQGIPSVLHGLSMSADGTVIFVELAPKKGRRGLSPGKPVVFNENGEILWEFEEKGSVGNIYVTRNGRFGYYIWGELHDEKGNTVNEREVVVFDLEKRIVKYFDGLVWPTMTEEGLANIYRRQQISIDSKDKPVTSYQFE